MVGVSSKSNSGDIQSALNRMRGKVSRVDATDPIAADPAPIESVKTATKRAAHREGKIQVAAFFDPVVVDQLDELELRLRREKGRRVTRQELVRDSINLLFEAHGMARIA